MYSAVGLGGGSTYIALMVLFGLSTSDIPVTALLCNICVVSINLFRYRSTPLPYRTLAALLASSIPMAYLGGHTAISPTFFQFLLGTVLILSGFAIGIQRTTLHLPIRMPIGHCLIIGGILGGVSGLVGIGGGIFLIPVLYAYNIGSPAQIARVASGFILLNSISGLLGQFSKVANFLFPAGHILLLFAVGIGALLGTQLHLYKLNKQHLQRISMILIISVGAKLIWEGWMACNAL